MPITDMQTRLVTIARESTWFWTALVAVRSLKLSSWCIGAGAIRNLVWDSLHDFEIPSALSDVDVAHFDASDLSAKSDAEIQHRLSNLHPYVPWEVTNQAAVHTWFEAAFGYPVSSLVSLQDAVASWPEFATSVGLSGPGFQGQARQRRPRLQARLDQSALVHRIKAAPAAVADMYHP